MLLRLSSRAADAHSSWTPGRPETGAPPAAFNDSTNASPPVSCGMSSLPMIPAPPRAERVAALYVGSQAPARGAPSSRPHHGRDRIADRRVRRTRWPRRLVAALLLFELSQEIAGLGAGRVVAGGLLVAAAG